MLRDRLTAPTDGVLSLEVRWILAGRLAPAVAAWFSASVPQLESREDSYLLSPDLGALSVKIRAGRALEVKTFLGSPGILDLAGRARGRMQYWRKWSFPVSSLSQDSDRQAGCWARVCKQRRIIRFALSGTRPEPAAADAREPASEARCAAELSELRTQQGNWWSLGLEATGPPGSLRTGLEATAALLFTEGLPDGRQLGLADSTSYPDWLRSRPVPGRDGSA